MDINTRIFAVGLFAHILFTTLSRVNAGIHHSVSCKICDFNQSVYKVSDLGSNFMVGDTLEFRVDDERNGIARVVSESDYEACRVVEGSKAVDLKGGEGIELSTSGFWYFISRISDRCKSGEKVMISVRVKNRSTRMGRGGGSAGGSGGSGAGNGGMGNAGGFNTPKGNGHHSNQKNTAGSLTRSTLILLLLAFYSILINVY